MNLGLRDVIIYSTVKPVTVREMQELDRNTIEDFCVPSIILMENAGRRVSEVAVDMLKSASHTKIAVFCGMGNNGGDGFVAGRYLARQGAEVYIYIIGDKSRIKNDPVVNLNILEKMGVRIEKAKPGLKPEADLIIDAIFGIGLKGEVKEPARSIIAELNKNKAPILSVDVPSGLDADTGEALGEAVKAKKTVTMQVPKKGFYINKGPEHVGEIVIADVGIFQP